jgi:hypothetical protein
MKFISSFVIALAIVCGSATVASAEPGNGSQQFTLAGTCDGVAVEVVIRKGFWSPFTVASSADETVIPVGSTLVPVTLSFTVTTPNGVFSWSGEKPGHANSETTDCSIGGPLFDGVVFEADTAAMLQP